MSVTVITLSPSSIEKTYGSKNIPVPPPGRPSTEDSSTAIGTGEGSVLEEISLAAASSFFDQYQQQDFF